MDAPDRCECSQSRAAWITFRLLLMLAGVSLAAYIPYKYATQLHATEGLYAFLFPFSSLLAMTGMALAIRPELAFRIPLFGRPVIAALAAGWMATGMSCVKALAIQVLASPGPGLFASFQMVAQHIFLSLAVAAIVLVPSAVFAQFGITPKIEPARKAERFAQA